MNDPTIVEFWRNIAIAGVTLLLGMVSFTVNQFVKRLDKHEREDRENFKALFDGQRNIASQIGEGFRQLDQTINARHVDVLNKLSDHIQNGN